MAKIAEMTQLSPTMSEGLIVKWIKKPGDKIEPGMVIAEVETDKAVMEMEAYDNAFIIAIIAEEGSKVKVGLPIAIIGKEGENADDLIQSAKAKLKSGSEAKAEAPKEESKPAPAPQPVVVEVKKETPPVIEKFDPPAPKPASTTVARKDGRLLASPLARSIALEKGIDIHQVSGSGPEGRITKNDILNFIANPSVKSSSKISKVSTKEEKKIEISGMRKVIATRLHDAKNNIPHFYLNLEFDAEPVFQMRKMLNSDLKASAERKKIEPESVSFNDFIVKACSIALERVPEVNSSWRGDHILQHGRIDIGIAVSVDGGLITPYVRNADELSILELHSVVKELANRARVRKLKPEEFTDGTFTISNLGMFGITNFSAIINEPEAALMAVGGLIEKPVIKNGAIVPGKTITVTLSCDHRVVDGAVGARFLSEFKDIVEHPYTIIK